MKTLESEMINAMHLANVMHAPKGAAIQWLNLFDIWQSGSVEIPYDAESFGRTIGVRRFPPEDSEGLPNDGIIWLHPHEHPGRIRVAE